MTADDFDSSNAKRESGEDTGSSFETHLSKTLPGLNESNTPEYVTVCASDDKRMPVMAVSPSYFREHVTADTKDRAKRKNLIYLYNPASSPMIVLTDNPEKYGLLLDIFGLESFLRKRCQGVI